MKSIIIADQEIQVGDYVELVSNIGQKVHKGYVFGLTDKQVSLTYEKGRKHWDLSMTHNGINHFIKVKRESLAEWSITFDWFLWYVGMFWDGKKRKLYIAPLPMVLIGIKFR